jgi:hypothetical protein
MNVKTFDEELSLAFLPIGEEDTIFYALVEDENTANYAAALVNPESSLPANNKGYSLYQLSEISRANYDKRIDLHCCLYSIKW